jgi:SAM-dependent methyltransferase
MSNMRAGNFMEISFCPVCGANTFAHSPVLWPDLIAAWQLSPEETDYVDRQQGTYCVSCGNNLRAMALASAIIDALGCPGDTLTAFSETAGAIAVLEINRAANLTSVLRNLNGHRLVEYPEFDMEALPFDSGSFDLVVHSDTLEHVPHPVRGLMECRRVLRPGGACVFTIPIIAGRLSRRRDSLPPSYHGGPGVCAADQIVHTEFGADFWKIVCEAGFRQCTIHAFEFPTALAIIARA